MKRTEKHVINKLGLIIAIISQQSRDNQNTPKDGVTEKASNQEKEKPEVENLPLEHEQPDVYPLDREEPEISELEENRPEETPEIEELNEAPTPDIDEITPEEDRPQDIN